MSADTRRDSHNGGETGRVLIVVDAQNDFCCKSLGRLYCRGAEDRFPYINALIEDIEREAASRSAENSAGESSEGQGSYAVIKTRDWHPTDHVEFAKYGVHCLQNSLLAEIHSGIRISRLDFIVDKGRRREVEAFSGFGSSLDETDTLQILDKVLPRFSPRFSSPPEVTVVGYALDICVEATAVDCKKLRPDLRVVVDVRGTAPYNLQDVPACLERLRAHGIVVRGQL